MRSPYLSPEQVGGLELHPATDVYTIGVMLYEMLTGWPPFTATNETILAMQHLRQEPVPLQTRLPQVSPVLAEIVHRALAKEPAARYRNASQLAHILAAQVKLTLPPVALPIQPAERLVVPAPPARPISRPATPLPARPATPPSIQPATPPPAQLTVPPPGEAAMPRPIRPPVPLTGRLPYAVTEQGYYSEEEMAKEQIDEPAGSDWLMVGLIVVALIAVLGLVPLWRTVYRRYTVPAPSPSPTPVVYHWSDRSYWPPLPAFDRAMAGSKLDNFGPIGYNSPSEAQDEHQLEDHGRLPARRPGSGRPAIGSFSGRRHPGGEITFGASG
jgi:hypothetical protein